MVIIKKYVAIKKEEKAKKKKKPKKKTSKYGTTFGSAKPAMAIEAPHVTELKREHERRRKELEKQKVTKKKGVAFKQSISRPVSFLINRGLVSKYCKTCNKNFDVSPDRMFCNVCETKLLKTKPRKPKKPVKTSSGKPKKPKKG